MEVAVKAQAEAEHKLKETLAKLSKVEKTHKNSESALQSFETQATNALKA